MMYHIHVSLQFEAGRRVRHGYVSVGDLEHCVHYKFGKLKLLT